MSLGTKVVGALPRDFDFGANWRRYLRLVDETRIESAVVSLRSMLGVKSLEGLRFLDAGCGSGLFSLAAHCMGAQVWGMDLNPAAVACAEELKRRFGNEAPRWKIIQGSILDANLLQGLGTFDVVYSWGVVHHTGSMWQALETVAERVAPGGSLFIAIYNDQGALSGYWAQVKRLYNASGLGRAAVIAVHAPYLIGLRWLVRRVGKRGGPERGMNLWYDMHDWLGGYPFEVATPERVRAWLAWRGFRMLREKTCGRRHGCNEFVAQREAGVPG